MKDIQLALEKAQRDVREKGPMAPSITNFVTIDFVANAQIAVGGSAAMVYMPDEGALMGEIADCVYINVGTLLPSHEETITAAAKAAFEKSAYVLDPVAIGIGALRTKLLAGMKEYPPKIVRGNASEVISLAKLWDLIDSDGGNVRGVDATDAVITAKESAEALARFIGGAVCVSGEEDLVTDGTRTVLSKGGSVNFTRITGSGCALGGVCAVYQSVTDPFTAALAATNAFNVAGAIGEKEAKGTASFKVAFIDALSNLVPEDLSHCLMEEI